MTRQAKVTFELLAPYNEDVQLIGSWNDWQPTPMQCGDDGIWRADVALDDGDYHYKFEVVSKSFFAPGERLRVADPKALEVTRDSDENAIIRIRGGKRLMTSYQWQHDDVPLPANHELIIYEMHIGEFRGGPGDSSEEQGTFQRVIEKLDYLVDLGINAVELMPVNEFPGHHSWGYSQRSIYAVENNYGTPDDLCHLVDECHARGIRVIHDTVYNHMEAEAPLTQIDYSYWFYEQNPDEAGLDFGPKFNYEHHDANLNIYPAREHVIGAMDQWVTLFHIDGLRFDATRALKYFDLLHWLHQEAHSRAGFKPFYTIAEHIPQDPTVAGPDGPVDAAWHDSFYRQMMATVLGVPFQDRDPFSTNAVLAVLDPRADGFPGAMNVIHYLNNHDEPRIMQLLGEMATTFDDAALRRNKLGATLLLTAPGVPMLWMGQEFGQSTPKTMERNPLHWALLENDLNAGLHAHYKHVIGLRKSNPALTSNNYETVLNQPERALLGFKRWNQDGNVVVVVANLKDEFAGDFEIVNVGLEDGAYREAINGYETQVTGGRLADSLGESEVKVFIKC